MSIVDLNPTIAQKTTPFENGFAVTVSDTVDLPIFSRGIWVGVGGTIVATPMGMDPASSLTFLNLPSGFMLPGRFRRIWATGTSASSLVAVY